MNRIDNMDLIDTHTGVYTREEKGAKLDSKSKVNKLNTLLFFIFHFFSFRLLWGRTLSVLSTLS